MAENNVLLQFVIDAKNNADAAFKAAEKNVQSLSDKFEEHSKTIHRVELAAAAAFAGMVLFAKSSIDKFAEAEKVDAQLNATLKSTGGIAGVTAQALNDLADSLSKSTAFSHEQVKQTEAMLLTFTNIHDNVFPQVTAAALDMATAMGTDATSAAQQLGKALNDPTQGLQMLGRVGVQFTDSQKKVIVSLAEGGRLAEAQGLILDELSKKFGGSASAAAETYAGKLEQLHNRMDDDQQLIGKGLIPVIADLEGAFLDTTEAMTGTTDISKATFTAFRYVAEFAASAAVQVTKVGAAITALAVDAYRYSPGRAFGLLDSPEQKAGFDATLARIGGVAEAADSFLQDFTDKNEQALAVIDGLSHETSKFGAAGAGAYSNVGDAAARAAADAEKARQKIEEIDKSLASLAKRRQDELAAKSGDETDTRASLAEAYVKQEQKVADLKKQIADEEKNIRASEGDRLDRINPAAEKVKQLQRDLASFDRDAAANPVTDAEALQAATERREKLATDLALAQRDYQDAFKETGTEKLDDLNEQLRKESGALERASTIKVGLAQDVAAAQKRAGMTEFERQIADIEAAQLKRDQDHQLKLSEIDAEVRAAEKQKADLGAIQEAVTQKANAEVAKREETAVKSIDRIIAKHEHFADVVTGRAPAAPVIDGKSGFGPTGAAGQGAGGGGGGSWSDASPSNLPGGETAYQAPAYKPLPPPSLQNAINFIFYGDVVDRDKFVADVKGAISRPTTLGFVAGGAGGN